MIIDAHTHVGPMFGVRPAMFPGVTADDLLPLLERGGIHKSCLFPPAWQGPRIIDPEHHQGNRAVHEAARQYPDRFFGFIRVDPNSRDGALDEMRRGHDEYGSRGLKLHPMCERFEVNNLRLMAPIMELCARYRWPIFFHAGYYTTCHPTIFIPLAERFPEVNVIIGHIGYAHVPDAIIAANLCPNIYLETSGNSTAAEIHDVLSKVPPTKFLYGSDLPFTDPRDVQAKIVNQPGITDDTRKLVMGANMARLLGLEPGREE